MSDDLYHNCGIAALYLLDKPMSPEGLASGSVVGDDVTPLLPSMLLDIQNRGQLAAGMCTYNPDRPQLLDTYKNVGTVIEAFSMSQPAKYEAILKEYSGKAAIGHTRYATCGEDDVRYAQPFERHHGRLWKWFAFAHNGQLANYTPLRDRLLSKRHYHFSLNTDTEIIMHSLAYRLRGDHPSDLAKVMGSMGRAFDGSYTMAFMDAMGRMFLAREPLGFRPLCWAVQGRLFGAASESVALTNMGFDTIHELAPGEMAIIEKGELRFERFARQRTHAHCFFEWVYFSNVGSSIAESSVYMARSRSGQRLAELEDQKITKNGDCIVVPVPDTAKAAADAYAYALGIPCVEGLFRNRYVGRTFIQPENTRSRSAKGKYTPLPAVLQGKKVFLIEDSIVRSTTMKRLGNLIRESGATEIHLRVACPPIVAPCFYGIDMSTLGELFAPKYMQNGYDGNPSEQTFEKMASALHIDSLRYLAVQDLAPCIDIDCNSLCTGCVMGKYPTDWGNKLMARAKSDVGSGKKNRTYE